MTTIVYDGKGTIAYDSRCVGDEQVYDDDFDKKYTSPEGVVGFVAGRPKDAETLLSYYLENKIGQELITGSSLLVWDPRDKTLWMCSTDKNDTFFADPMKLDKPVGIGSGRDLALGAIDAGLNAKEAVKLACKRDIYSGGRVRTYKVK